MTRILHLIELLDMGGGTRSAIAVAKWSARAGHFHHDIVALKSAEPVAIVLAEEAGMKVHVAPTAEALDHLVTQADLVQVEYWNAPYINTWLQRAKPEMRLILWHHIAGNSLPHVITPALAASGDLHIACNPFTYSELPAFEPLRSGPDADRLAMVYDPADFDRLPDVTPIPHDGFNVGYIGTVNFVKMHRHFVDMSSAVNIPDVSFIVCGQGIEAELKRQATVLGAADRFDFKGYVEDIASVIRTLDVYGYPLCEDTYAAAELNLQEVMYAGVPPVAFPYGGIGSLIQHNETGLLVHSEAEYTAAIEYLYHHPEERARLGKNARAYAQTHFGAENASHQINQHYASLLQRPKRLHQPEELPPARPSTAQLFADSLGPEGIAFEQSLHVTNPTLLLAADQTIADSSLLTFKTGLLPYRQFDENDPYLRLWCGLYLELAGDAENATGEFAQAYQLGLQHWRVQWYLVRTLRAVGQTDLANELHHQLKSLVPEFDALVVDYQTATGRTAQPTALLKTRYRVSAVVSTYASSAFMAGCLENLVNQSLYQKGELEIIVIDAHSPESEGEIVAAYQQRYQHIRYVRTDERENLYQSWNRAIKMASAPYITNANTDDRHRNDALEVLADFLDLHQGIALVYPGQIDTSVPHETFANTTSAKRLDWPTYSYHELERHCIIGSQPVWRRNLHNAYGFFREDLTSAADYEFWLRIGKKERMHRYPETLGLYYRNEAGLEHGSDVSKRETIQIWREYGMFERGVLTILNGRLFTSADAARYFPETANNGIVTLGDYIQAFEKATKAMDLVEAEHVADAAAGQFPEHSYPVILKAMMARMQGRMPEALLTIERALTLGTTPEALLELMQITLAAGEYGEARRTGAYLVQLYPNWQSIVEQLIGEVATEPSLAGSTAEDNLTLSLIQDQFTRAVATENIPEANRLTRLATEQFPDAAESWIMRARYQRLRGKQARAQDALQQALLIENSPDALVELVHTLKDANAVGDARKLAAFLTEHHPSCAPELVDVLN